MTPEAAHWRNLAETELQPVPAQLSVPEAVELAVAEERRRCSEIVRRFLVAPGGPAVRNAVLTILARIMKP